MAELLHWQSFDSQKPERLGRYGQLLRSAESLAIELGIATATLRASSIAFSYAVGLLALPGSW